MASKLVFVFVQALIFEVALSQCVRNINGINIPNFGPCQALPTITEVVPTRQVLPSPCPNQILPTALLNSFYDVPKVITPTIIQDNTVTNNLANALQLLVVSNLLSNKLPLNAVDDVIISAPFLDGYPGCVTGYPGFVNQVAAPACGCGGYGGLGCGCGYNGVINII